MPRVVGVRFRQTGKVYYFAPGELDARLGDQVLAYTKQGLEMGEIALAPTDMQDDALNGPLKRVLRKATPGDLNQEEANRRKAAEAASLCAQRIAAHGLPMKLIQATYTFDRKRLVFLFTAENRVDFRQLVRELAGMFRTRIELRQIGVRDEAKLLGGLGPCGRPLCCATHLRSFEPVAIRMAKSQGLSLNPTKISGVCGRLMCCLRYEREVYDEGRKGLPPVGSMVETPEGEGQVVNVNVLRETVTVHIETKGPLPFAPTRVRVLGAPAVAEAEEEPAPEDAELLALETEDEEAVEAEAELEAEVVVEPEAVPEPSPAPATPATQEPSSGARRGKRRRGRRGRGRRRHTPPGQGQSGGAAGGDGSAETR